MHPIRPRTPRPESAEDVLRCFAGFGHFFEGAHLLVKENWASVKAIAERLHSTKELDYAGALKIAEANGLAKMG